MPMKVRCKRRRRDELCGLRTAIEDFEGTLGQTPAAHYHPQRNPQEVGIGKLLASTNALTVIKKDVDSFRRQIIVDSLCLREHFVRIGIKKEEVHREGRDRRRPEDASAIGEKLNERTKDTSRPDAIASHHYRHRLIALVHKRKPERFRKTRPQTEDVAYFNRLCLY